MLTAALAYAERGWQVFPVHNPTPCGCSCSKGTTCNKVGKHPRTPNGFGDATANEVQVRDWWSKWPEANIGIRTGSQSGLVVVDVDNRDGRQGSDSLSRLAASNGMLPRTLTATTGSGEHLFFNHPGGIISNSVGTLAESVDIRADGGYIVAPPSLHKNGKRYAWLDATVPVADGPDWLILELSKGKRGRLPMSHTDTEEHSVESTITEGARNDTLYKTGCALRGQMGKDRSDILPSLLAYNIANCNPPLEEEEVIRIVDSVCLHPLEFGSNKSGRRQQDNPLYWFKFNTREWFSDQCLNLMTDVQTGWYIRLKAFAWDAGGFLPADRSKLYKLAKARSRKVFERDCDIVLAGYEEVVIDGEHKLKDPKLAEAYSETLAKWMQKKQSAEEGRTVRLSALKLQPQASLSELPSTPASQCAN